MLPCGLGDCHSLFGTAGAVVVVGDIEPALPVTHILLAPLPIAQQHLLLRSLPTAISFARSSLRRAQLRSAVVDQTFERRECLSGTGNRASVTGITVNTASLAVQQPDSTDELACELVEQPIHLQLAVAASLPERALVHALVSLEKYRYLPAKPNDPKLSLSQSPLP